MYRKKERLTKSYAKRAVTCLIYIDNQEKKKKKKTLMLVLSRSQRLRPLDHADSQRDKANYDNIIRNMLKAKSSAKGYVISASVSC